VRAVVWSDYICPWCYLGQDRTALLESLGVEVTVRPYELHPEIPVGGVATERRFSRIAAACTEVGLPFAAPTRTPNSRRALIAAEAVRISAPAAFAVLHRSLFAAHFVEGRDIGDQRVIDELVADAGADPDAIERDPALLFASVEAAHDNNVAGTPAWWIEDRLLIPGVQDRDYYIRMLERLSSRPS
jgi:predicted DsbA family dithiol-disulfide isomerase